MAGSPKRAAAGGHARITAAGVGHMGGLPGIGRYGRMLPARSLANPMWPGITEGHDARCSCTWAAREGVYQVKVLDAGCVIRAHRQPGESGG